MLFLFLYIIDSILSTRYDSGGNEGNFKNIEKKIIFGHGVQSYNTSLTYEIREIILKILKKFKNYF